MACRWDKKDGGAGVPTAAFKDYLGYFFFGYKTDAMNQAILAILRGLHYVVISALSILVFNVYTAVIHGTFEFTWEAWQQYLIPAIIFILGFLNEALRKYLNPSVSVKTLPSSVTTEESASLKHEEQPVLKEPTPLREIPREDIPPR